MVGEGPSQRVELGEAGPAEGDAAVAAGLEALAGRGAVAHVARSALLLLGLKAQDDVGQRRVLRQPVDAIFTCKPPPHTQYRLPAARSQ